MEPCNLTIQQPFAAHRTRLDLLGVQIVQIAFACPHLPLHLVDRLARQKTRLHTSMVEDVRPNAVVPPCRTTRKVISEGDKCCRKWL